MLRRAYCALLPVMWMIALCATLHAQAGKTITLRLLDGKTGRVVAPTGFLVRANHQPTLHGEWVQKNDDGTAELNIPEGISVLSIQATYENSMEIYFNCDSPKQAANPSELWYPVSEILTTGLVAPDGCVKPKAADKLKVTAKPGEFVFFVRKLGWREQD